MKSYKTIEGFASSEYIVKKSRFIGYAKPTKTPDEAVEFINEIRAKHRDATHNVYAYIIDRDNIVRYSDDGEPQGTAGIPALDVLKKEELVNLCVVATRYFGGIMLGAGGLVRAYAHTAKIAVDAAHIIEMKECALCRCECDYNFYGRLTPLLLSFGAKISDTDFADNVTVSFSIPLDELDRLNTELIDKSNGKYSAEKTGEKFMAV